MVVIKDLQNKLMIIRHWKYRGGNTTENTEEITDKSADDLIKEITEKRETISIDSILSEQENETTPFINGLVFEN